MYKISIPIFNRLVHKSDPELVLKLLKELNADRVFLNLGRYIYDDAKRAEEMAFLKENTAFLKAHGYEVGAYVWTFWLDDNAVFQNKVSISGKEVKDSVCPADPGFLSFVAGYVADMVNAGVDIVFFDDDFRYGCLEETPACLCPLHLEKVWKLLGEQVPREELEKNILSGQPNPYRNAYLQANGDAFREFAGMVRSTVDAIDPKVRVGFCACMTSWDVDGTDAWELAGILAGNTKPLVRMIGATYWAVDRNWGNSLQDVVELGRLESTWTRQGDIELLVEGDPYPRPRTCCPANYLEGYDMAFRAAGCADGILKWFFGHHNLDYETGYFRMQKRNWELYGQIEKLFGDKKHCGVRVYESMRKLPDMVLPTPVNSKIDLNFALFSKAARTLAHTSVPTVYEGSGVCGIVFDENARHLPADALNNGLILDITAAQILTEKGVDVGLVHIGDSFTGGMECFVDDGNRRPSRENIHYRIRISPDAQVLSNIEHSGQTVPFSYRYENAAKQRFLVLNINTRTGTENLLREYARSRQYATQIPWLGGKKLPAYTYGNPELYLQCKANDKAMAVGLWNFFADPAFEPVIELDRAYSKITFLNCSGRLEGDRVYLEEIPPFGFAAFSVEP